MSATIPGANDLAQFKVTFFEECAELLADMEARIQHQQTEPADHEELNAIFRAVHSIKAGAGAFGFSRLVRFSHIFEALLDRLRDGRIGQTPRVSGALLSAGDILASLVEKAQSGQEPEPEFGAEILEDLAALTREADGDAAAPAAAAPATPHHAAAGGALRRLDILFRPHANLFRNANEPLLLLRDMRQHGEMTVACDLSRLPALDKLEVEDAVLAWRIELTTASSDEAIREIFEFVDDCCDLEITCREILAEEKAVSSAPITGPSAPPAAEPARTAKAPSRSAAPAGEAHPEPAARSGGKAGSAVTSIRVDLPRIDRLVNMVGELVITQAMLAQQIAEHSAILGNATLQGQEDLSLLIRELQDCVMAIRMQPVKSVFQRMPRMVRDISGRLGKKVILEMSGEQTEVDKTVIEELADPLTHMIRNSIDHGIESPADRRARGKPEEGTVTLSAAHVGSNILIHVEDDGAGINRERLLQKAIEKGIVHPEAKLTEEEIDDLIFAPGFSTAREVTEVSGRGVGMDVVRRNITNLGGRVQVSSVPGKGTRFTLVIPLTLAVLDGMIVAVGEERYILPLTSIIESYRPDMASMRTIPGGAQVAAIRGEYIQLIYLQRLFAIPDAVTDASRGLVVLVETAAGHKVGIVVDELLGQQQVVIKSLHDNFDPIRGISGATILGNGRVALILDVEELTAMVPSARGALRFEGRSEGRAA